MNFAPGAWRYALPPLLAAPFALIFSTAASVLALVAGAGVLGFFRDPDRTPPPTGAVSPADGTVSVLREEGDRVRLGVFMNVWNVHVVRAPFDGTVDSVEHSPGAHRPAFSKDSDRNEKVHVRFEGENDDLGGSTDAAERPETDATEAVDGGPGSVAGDDTEETVEITAREREVTLIAGAFARRIHPYVGPGDELERGERIGHIAFGSRVDVLFPASVDREDVRVSLGESVTAGETVIYEGLDERPALDLDVEGERIDDPDGADVDADDAGVATDGGERP